MRIQNFPNPKLESFGRAAQGGNGDDFAGTLMDALDQVNASQAQARETQNQFMAGQPVDFHDLMVQMEQASLGMQLTMQVRNKLLEGYQEITRMQV